MAETAMEILLSHRPAEQVSAKVTVIRSTAFGAPGVPGANALDVEEQTARNLDQEPSNNLCKMVERLASENPASLGSVMMSGLGAVGDTSFAK